MLKFTDKEILDGYNISNEVIKQCYKKMFHNEEEAKSLDICIKNLSNKMVEDFIKTGKLDDYIGKYGHKFDSKLANTIERDIGGVLISILKQWKYVELENWQLCIDMVRTRKSYEKIIEIKQEYGSISRYEHQLTEKYNNELNEILNIVFDGVLAKSEKGEKDIESSKKLLLKMLSDEIRTKEDLFTEQILEQVNDIFNEKFVDEKLQKLFDGNQKKMNKTYSMISTLIDRVMKDENFTMFFNLSEYDMKLAKTRLEQQIVSHICDSIYYSQSYLCNDIYLGKIKLNQYDFNIDLKNLDEYIENIAQKIGNITIVSETRAMYDSELVSLMEEGYTIEQGDECQFESLQYILNNECTSIINLEISIKNGINQAIQDIINTIISKEDIGDDVLNKDGIFVEKSNGSIAQYVDSVKNSYINKDEFIYDEEIK